MYFQEKLISIPSCELQKGSQQICVESPGLHELHFVNSCIFFGSSSMKIDTLNPSVHSLYSSFIIIGSKYIIDINIIYLFPSSSIYLCSLSFWKEKSIYLKDKSMLSLGHLMVNMNYLRVLLWTFWMVGARSLMVPPLNLVPLRRIKQVLPFMSILCGLILETNSLFFLGTQGVYI